MSMGFANWLVLTIRRRVSHKQEPWDCQYAPSVLRWMSMHPLWMRCKYTPMTHTHYLVCVLRNKCSYSGRVAWKNHKCFQEINFWFLSPKLRTLSNLSVLCYVWYSITNLFLFRHICWPKISPYTSPAYCLSDWYHFSFVVSILLHHAAFFHLPPPQSVYLFEMETDKCESKSEKEWGREKRNMPKCWLNFSVHSVQPWARMKLKAGRSNLALHPEWTRIQLLELSLLPPHGQESEMRTEDRIALWSRYFVLWLN